MGGGTQDDLGCLQLPLCAAWQKRASASTDLYEGNSHQYNIFGRHLTAEDYAECLDLPRYFIHVQERVIIAWA